MDDPIRGPWRVPQGDYKDAVVDNRGAVVCRVEGRDPRHPETLAEVDAKRALIAAAPAMLKALESVMQKIEHGDPSLWFYAGQESVSDMCYRCTGGGPIWGDEQPDCPCVFHAARDAIAHAKGGDV